MFERFTEDARQVVVAAQEQARGLNHDYIGTEHMLLGLLVVDGIAEATLTSFGVTAERARSEVIRRVGGAGTGASGQIPFTPRAKKVLERALREALGLGHDVVGSEHIVLGLVGERDGVAAQILAELGADPDAIREAVLEKISVPGYRPEPRLAMALARGATRRHVEPIWLGGAGDALNRLASEIRRELRRDPDPGDLLLVLALTPDTVAAAALQELGADSDTLWATVERIRQTHRREQEELANRISEVRGAKERAIERGELDRAARLRDEERELTERTRAGSALNPEVLGEIRRTLGLPNPPDGP
jgi:ATP-dependent Clp protease ATP-binding subunit ClpA